MSTINNKFLGWAQYTKEEFKTLSFAQKAGRLIFVRDFDENGILKGSEIYFGSRLYAQTSDNVSSKINNIIKSLGENVGEDGVLNPFDLELHPIIGNENTFIGALYALETSLNSLISNITDLTNRVEVLETTNEVTGDDI